MKKILIALASLALVVSSATAEEFKTSLNAGLALTDGNSETLAVNVALVTEGEREGLGSVIAGVEANYGESTVAEVKETTVENAKVYANVKKTLTEKTFASLDGSVFFDNVADIDYRATLGPGLGVFVIKNDMRTLSLEAGPSYVWEKVGGVEDDYLALRVTQRYTCQMTETAKLVQSLEYVPEVEDFDNYLLTAEVGIEVAINTRLSLRAVLQNKYDSTPAEGKERNDLSLITGLSLAL